jgi:hypothetical protein
LFALPIIFQHVILHHSTFRSSMSAHLHKIKWPKERGDKKGPQADWRHFFQIIVPDISATVLDRPLPLLFWLGWLLFCAYQPLFGFILAASYSVQARLMLVMIINVTY